MIGIFDSGVGGLSLVKELFDALPEYEITYFGDSGRTPYGNKSLDTVRLYSEQLYDFLNTRGAQTIIIACNTASAAAADYLRLKNEKPVFDVIKAACNGALSATKNGNIGIMGTASTIKSEAHAVELKKSEKLQRFYEFSCPSLATLIEDTEVSEDALEGVIKSYMREMDNSMDTIILGCTHYPLISDTIQKIVGESVSLIDPAGEVVKEIKSYLQEHPDFEKSLRRGKGHKFFVSDEKETFARLVYKFLGKTYTPEIYQF